MTVAVKFADAAQGSSRGIAPTTAAPSNSKTVAVKFANAAQGSSGGIASTNADP